MDLLVCCVDMLNHPVFSSENKEMVEELLKEASRFDSEAHRTICICSSTNVSRPINEAHSCGDNIQNGT